jgi:hypothetical protein
MSPSHPNVRLSQAVTALSTTCRLPCVAPQARFRRECIRHPRPGSLLTCGLKSEDLDLEKNGEGNEPDLGLSSEQTQVTEVRFSEQKENPQTL